MFGWGDFSLTTQIVLNMLVYQLITKCFKKHTDRIGTAL